ncbi:CHAP domain-containing protein [Nonomuraea sp. NPDC000554]|uniref:CHAP domain-containing protein n=1 Tax=Nonomuraea sp. NPDC000554 TaxID=3154259 RepID=UPI003330E95C
MAMHRLARAPKFSYARAALGATVIAAAIAAPTAANAQTTPSAALTHQHSQVRPADHERSGKVKVTAAQVLSLAKAQIGTSENAMGGGTKFQKWYAASARAAETIQRDGGTRADYINAAWCSMFVSWIGDKTGLGASIGSDAYTVEHAKWFKHNDHWGTAPKPGAVVFFAWSGSKSLDDINHVGFVVKANGDGTISTIEGNTGNGVVEQRVRPTSQVVGYGYPDYAA